MSKTLTLRVDEETYWLIRQTAQAEQRSIANLILTSALSHIREQQFVDEHEMAEIRASEVLLERIEQGSRDARDGKGRFVD